MALHLLTAQRGVVQHFFAPLGAGVEHHSLAENRRHERVRLSLIEILIGGTEEELVGLRTRQQDDMLVDQLEPTDIAAFVADPLHQTDRIGAKFLEMSVFFLSAGDTRNDRGGHEFRFSSCSLLAAEHPRSWLFTAQSAQRPGWVVLAQSEGLRARPRPVARRRDRSRRRSTGRASSRRRKACAAWKPLTPDSRAPRKPRFGD